MKKIFTVLAFMLFVLVVSAQQIDRNLVLLEIGTGTWCVNCPAAARGADQLHANGDPVAIIENHNGDAYANTYSNTRNAYNGVPGYPTANFDGSWGSVIGGSYGGNMYSSYLTKVNQRIQIQTSFDIEIFGSYTGNDYDIIVRVTKVADYSGTNLKVRLALTESHIQQNWQGMTELNFVNRLMVPDANGTLVTFTSIGQSIDVPLSFTFDNSWDIDHCELVAFIQDDGSKEALNAETEMITDVQPAIPVADFSGSPLSGYPPLSVDFTNLSTGLIDTYDWTFGDGNTSIVENPTNEYTNPGTYTVSLTVTGTGGSDTETKTEYIDVIPLPPAPVADFEGDVTEGPAPLVVHFADLSSSVIDDWDWDFGNGGSSGLQNPTYMFSSPGTYTISLTVAGPGGSDSEIKVDYITVTEPVPEPDFTATPTYGPVPLTVNFTDMSEGTIDTWYWEFGDGSTSDQQNPEHIFTTEDYFDVSLTVTGPGGTDIITKDDFINTANLVSLDVSATPEELCVGETSLLNADATGGTGSYTYSWTSDPEGFVSDVQNPEATPTETTTYMVEVSDGEQIVSSEIEVTVNLLPEITLGEWPEELCNEQEPPIQLTATPAGGTFGGNNITPEGVFSPEEAPLGWNIITYTYEDENGCENTATDSIYVDQCVGVNYQLAIDESASVFPNPNRGIFTIKSYHSINKVEIVNMRGEIVFTGLYDETELSIHAQLNQGIYIIHIFVSDNQGFSQIIRKEVVIN